MATTNPLILTKDNVNDYVNVLQDLISNSDQKPVLFVIKADWCGYCVRFAETAWNDFKKQFKTTTHFQMVEINDVALNTMKTKDKNLYTSLLIDPARVYFPQVYMLINSDKKVFQPDYTPKGALNALINWVDKCIPRRKVLRTKVATTGKKVTGGSAKKKSSSTSRNKKTGKSKVIVQTKKSLKEEIDAAFNKLFLR